ncbi:serine/arginine repetitive matrix protein 3-like [Pongo abelii]|uniref:serine/arginine repetitive matrix protein 3-like n=1 Tax=Pongo abelii TaxID=9601 RepID=UPI0023E77C05|nr:serine/arginine repetitive matrix protein 3-like [Pongo abelii]
MTPQGVVAPVASRGCGSAGPHRRGSARAPASEVCGSPRGARCSRARRGAQPAPRPRSREFHAHSGPGRPQAHGLFCTGPATWGHRGGPEGPGRREEEPRLSGEPSPSPARGGRDASRLVMKSQGKNFPVQHWQSCHQEEHSTLKVRWLLKLQP